MDILLEGLNTLGFTALEIERCKPLLETYVHELELFNSAYDLVGADTREDIIIRHILDSLSPVKNLRLLAAALQTDSVSSLSIADIGSGGGLPGIPLAICFPEYKFTLLERMSKRCAFLENCSVILGLKNVQVDNTEAERARAEQFDIAVFRAFRPLDKKMTKTILGLIKSGGFLAAYKGKLEKIEEEMSGIKDICPEWKAEPLMVPFLEDTHRYLVIVKKN